MVFCACSRRSGPKRSLSVSNRSPTPPPLPSSGAGGSRMSGGAASIGGSAAGPCSCTGAASGSRAKRSARACAPCAGPRVAALTPPPVSAPAAKASATSHGSSWRFGSRYFSAPKPTPCWAASVRPSVSDSRPTWPRNEPAGLRKTLPARPAGTIDSRPALITPLVVAARSRSSALVAASVGSAYWFSAASPRSRP